MESPDKADPGLRSETVTLPARGWRIDPGRALLASAVCWIGFTLVVVAVLGGQSNQFDAAGLRLWRTGIDLHPRGAPWLSEAVRDYTALGGVLLRHIVAIGALVALLFLRLRREDGDRSRCATGAGPPRRTGWTVHPAPPPPPARNQPSTPRSRSGRDPGRSASRVRAE